MNQLVAFTDRAPALIAAAGARASYRFLLGGIAALRRGGRGASCFTPMPQKWPGFATPRWPTFTPPLTIRFTLR
jgi:hypothetical protein